jgi:hypothetical protein
MYRKKKNHTVTAAQVATKLNICLQDSVSTKAIRRELFTSNIHSRAVIAKLPITESNAQVPK